MAPQWVEIEPRDGFVETPFITGLVERAETYLAAGCAIHLRGTSGVGKTTLALHIAARRDRPVVLLHGDEEMTTSAMVGAAAGYRIRTVRDNFIRSVQKFEEDCSRTWTDDRLTAACRHGFTLLYDEFNRSRPVANNVLLSVLQEGVLVLPPGSPGGERYVQVHPEFRAIFTSNPEEYAGVHRTQDALLGRLVTLAIGPLDRDTEVAITRARSGGLDDAFCTRIVDMVRAVRASSCPDSDHHNVRTNVTLARIFVEARARGLTRQYRAIFRDVLSGDLPRNSGPDELERFRTRLEATLDLFEIAEAS